MVLLKIYDLESRILPSQKLAALNNRGNEKVFQSLQFTTVYLCTSPLIVLQV